MKFVLTEFVLINGILLYIRQFQLGSFSNFSLVSAVIKTSALRTKVTPPPLLISSFRIETFFFSVQKMRRKQEEQSVRLRGTHKVCLPRSGEAGTASGTS